MQSMVGVEIFIGLASMQCKDFYAVLEILIVVP